MATLHVASEIIRAITNITYPVGSIYMSTSSTSPASFLGGSWTQWGQGRVPVGINTNDGSFNTSGKTGGEKSHKLTISEMPSHSHSSRKTAQGLFAGWGYENVDGWVAASVRGNGRTMGCGRNWWKRIS